MHDIWQIVIHLFGMLPHIFILILLLLFCKKKRAEYTCQVDKEAGVCYIKHGSNEDVFAIRLSEIERRKGEQKQKEPAKEGTTEANTLLSKTKVNEKDTPKAKDPALPVKQIKEVPKRKSVSKKSKGESMGTKSLTISQSMSEEKAEDEKENEDIKKSTRKTSPTQKSSKKVKKQISMQFGSEKDEPNKEASEQTQETREITRLKKDKEKSSEEDKPIKMVPKKKKKQIIQLVETESEGDEKEERHLKKSGVKMKPARIIEAKKSNADVSKKFDLTQVRSDVVVKERDDKEKEVKEKEKVEQKLVKVKEKKGGDIKAMFKNLAQDPRVMSILSEAPSDEDSKRRSEGAEDGYNNPLEVDVKKRKLYKTGKLLKQIKVPDKKRTPPPPAPAPQPPKSEPKSESVKFDLAKDKSVLSKISKMSKISQQRDNSNSNSNIKTKASAANAI